MENFFTKNFYEPTGYERISMYIANYVAFKNNEEFINFFAEFTKNFKYITRNINTIKSVIFKILFELEFENGDKKDYYKHFYCELKNNYSNEFLKIRNQVLDYTDSIYETYASFSIKVKIFEFSILFKLMAIYSKKLNSMDEKDRKMFNDFTQGEIYLNADDFKKIFEKYKITYKEANEIRQQKEDIYVIDGIDFYDLNEEKDENVQQDINLLYSIFSSNEYHGETFGNYRKKKLKTYIGINPSMINYEYINKQKQNLNENIKIKIEKNEKKIERIKKLFNDTFTPLKKELNERKNSNKKINVFMEKYFKEILNLYEAKKKTLEIYTIKQKERKMKEAEFLYVVNLKRLQNFFENLIMELIIKELIIEFKDESNIIQLKEVNRPNKIKRLENDDDEIKEFEEKIKEQIIKARKFEVTEKDAFIAIKHHGKNLAEKVTNYMLRKLDDEKINENIVETAKQILDTYSTIYDASLLFQKKNISMFEKVSNKTFNVNDFLDLYQTKIFGAVSNNASSDKVDSGFLDEKNDTFLGKKIKEPSEKNEVNLIENLKASLFEKYIDEYDLEEVKKNKDIQNDNIFKIQEIIYYEDLTDEQINEKINEYEEKNKELEEKHKQSIHFSNIIINDEIEKNKLEIEKLKKELKNRGDKKNKIIEIENKEKIDNLKKLNKEKNELLDEIDEMVNEPKKNNKEILPDLDKLVKKSKIIGKRIKNINKEIGSIKLKKKVSNIEIKSKKNNEREEKLKNKIKNRIKFRTNTEEKEKQLGSISNLKTLSDDKTKSVEKISLENTLGTISNIKTASDDKIASDDKTKSNEKIVTEAMETKIVDALNDIIKKRKNKVRKDFINEKRTYRRLVNKKKKNEFIEKIKEIRKEINETKAKIIKMRKKENRIKLIIDLKSKKRYYKKMRKLFFKKFKKLKKLADIEKYKSEKEVKKERKRISFIKKDKKIEEIEEIKDKEIEEIKDKENEEIKDKEIEEIKDKEIEEIKDKEIEEIKDKEIEEIKDKKNEKERQRIRFIKKKDEEIKDKTFGEKYAEKFPALNETRINRRRKIKESLSFFKKPDEDDKNKKYGKFIEMPLYIKKMRNVFNIKTNKENENKCFLLCTLAHLTNEKKTFNINRTLKKLVNGNQIDILLNKTNELQFPTNIYQIENFAKNNNFCYYIWNVEEPNSIEFKIYLDTVINKKEKIKETIHLLKYYDHFALITDPERFMKSKNTFGIHNSSKICDLCYQVYFNSEELLEKHKNVCFMAFDKPSYYLPDENYEIKFENIYKQVKKRNIVYADCESILQSCNQTFGKSVKSDKHIPIAIGSLFMENERGFVVETYKEFFGENCVENFINSIMAFAKTLYNKMMTLKNKQNYPFKVYKKFIVYGVCSICKKKINNELITTIAENNEFIDYGPVHEECLKNFNFRLDVTVFFHNLKGYDSHFLIDEFAKKFKNFFCIPKSKEKNVMFSGYYGNKNDIKISFVDSFAFLNSSLDSLSSKLTNFRFKKNFDNISAEYYNRKMSFPYEYVDSIEKLYEKELPKETEKWYSKLTQKNVEQEKIDDAINSFNKLKMETIKDYMMFYLKIDVFLLAEVYENFRNTAINNYDLDPCHYFTTPGFAWDCALKFSKIVLEPLKSCELVSFFNEEGVIRGGISSVSTIKHKKIKNENESIFYFDVTNLYGYAMTYPLPFGNFEIFELNKESLNDQEQNIFDNWTFESNFGYIYEVDLTIPDCLHFFFNDLPPFVEKTNGKLIANLNDKFNYKTHICLLKQGIRFGVKIIKYHRVVKFDQKPWLKEYVEFNTLKRKNSTDKTEKDFFKLMNNAVYGKTMENIFKQSSLKFYSKNDKRFAERDLSKGKIKFFDNFTENLIYGEKCTIPIFNKPIYVGFCILEISKMRMYELLYDVIKKNFQKSMLMYMDTDSFVISMNESRKDVIDKLHNIAELKNNFDLSGYGIDFSNEGKLGTFKDEYPKKIIKEFITIRSKTYFINFDNGEIVIKNKGCVKSENSLSIDDFTNSLYNEEYKKDGEQSHIRSFNHDVYTVVAMKNIINSKLDDKRITLFNSDGKRTEYTIPIGSKALIN